MTDHNKHIKQYTVKDFELYHSGKMSSQEMHLLEKAALEDPFLEDALDGYKFAQTPVKDIEGLQDEINARTKQGKVIPLQKTRNLSFLWKAAAMIIIALGLGWAVFNVAFNDTSKDIAAVNQPLEATAPSTLQNSADTQKTTEANETTASIQQSTDAVSTISKNQPSVKEKTVKKSNRQAVNGSIASSNGRQKSVNLNLREDAMVRGNKFSDFSHETNDAVVISAQATKPPAEGIRNERKQGQNDSVVGVGYGTQRRASAENNNVIVLEKIKDNKIDEVIVGQSKSDTNFLKNRISFEEAEPENGYSSYDDYVAQNLAIPERQVIKKSTGKVELSFDVNNVGEAVNIKVEKSLCKECDEEAIRILKEGPKWVQKKKNKKGRISIRF